MPAPFVECRMQPLAANEPVSQKADVGLLRDRLQAAVKFLDFAGETRVAHRRRLLDAIPRCASQAAKALLPVPAAPLSQNSESFECLRHSSSVVCSHSRPTN